MLGLFFTAVIKILEWSLVSAAVLTYIEIGPGGDSLAAIVESIKLILLDIDWSSLAHNIAGHVQNLVSTLWESFSDSDIGKQAEAINACSEGSEHCDQSTGKN